MVFNLLIQKKPNMKSLGLGRVKGKATPCWYMLDHCDAVEEAVAWLSRGCCSGMLSQPWLCWYRAGEGEGSIKCHVCSLASQLTSLCSFSLSVR